MADVTRTVTKLDPLDPHSYNIALNPELHALAWVLDAYKAALAGEPTPGSHVVSFAEGVLRDAADALEGKMTNIQRKAQAALMEQGK